MLWALAGALSRHDVSELHLVLIRDLSELHLGFTLECILAVSVESGRHLMFTERFV